MKNATKKEVLKILHFVLMFPLTLLLFRGIISQTGFRTGYWLSFAIYWIAIISFTVYYYGFKGIAGLFKQQKGNQVWTLAAYIPVIATLIISFIPSFFKLDASMKLLVLGTGLINGFCEELFWRGLTVKTAFKSKAWVVLASLIGFGLWHFTLGLCNGPVYQGGIPALVGGAVFMGIIWQFIVSKTGNILYVTIAHILTNIFAFSTMILENWQQ